MKPEKEFDRDTVRAQVVKKLQEANGKSFSPRQMSLVFKVGAASIKTMCGELCKEGTLRVGRNECDAEGYYFPTEKQRNLEWEMAERVSRQRELRPRKEHWAAVERALAARQEHKSIG